MFYTEEERLRFWNKVDIAEEDSCWVWKGRLDRDGYGKAHSRRRRVRSHRLAFEMAYGYLPAVVMHRCDQPSCCNPHHLQAGDQLTNVLDRDRKGRQARGARNGRAKLTEEVVREIKLHLSHGELSQAELARRFEISTSVIRDIERKKTWRHV